MKFLNFLFFLILLPSITFSQNEKSAKGKNTFSQYPHNIDSLQKVHGDSIFNIVEKQPEYPGGFEAMSIFLGENFDYPEIAIKKHHSGTVYVMFVIEKDGSVSNVSVISGVSEELDAESIRVVSIMPKWIPGKQLGKPIRARFTLPIKCRLPGSKKKKKKKN